MVGVRADAYITELLKCLGRGYVYGTIMETCTIQTLERCYRMYGSKFGANYFQLNGDYTKGRSARWLGKIVCDCSGLVEATYNKMVGASFDYSADGFYQMCDNKNKIDKANPLDGLKRGDALFVHSSKSNKKDHIGIYIGNGQAIESRGVDWGVVITKVVGRGWTHSGELPFIIYERDDVRDRIDKSFKNGIISSVDVWRKYLNGEEEPNPEFIKWLLIKAMAILDKRGENEKLVYEANRYGVVNSPMYWLDIIDGKAKPKVEYLNALVDQINIQIEKLEGL